MKHGLAINLVNVTVYTAGVVKYVGILDNNLLAPSCFVGVHLDEQGSISETNKSYTM